MTPKAAGYFAPAEWESQESLWVAWPSHAELWLDGLDSAQESFTHLAQAIALAGDDAPHLHVCVPNDAADRACAKALGRVRHTRHHEEFGDIWLRDTAPIFLRNPAGERAAAVFRFNGWGGKYVLPGDDTLALRIAKRAHCKHFSFPFVLEGGSVECDGDGTVLTTRQCLLHPNRNPGMAQSHVEESLHAALGTEKVVWLSEGLAHDHTDGHIDTIARFVAPGVVVCMEPRDADDPNREVLLMVRRALEATTDARGRRIEVCVVPSPGRVLDANGQVMPASHVNFLVTNGVVVVPLYETAWDAAVVHAVEPLFPGRRVVGVQAKALLRGGGAFHCITQQVPAARDARPSAARGLQ